MKRILFVDDERLVLEGLENLLRSRRRMWQMVFVDGAEAALSELARAPFDVIISDMRMPRIDGSKLLHRVQDEYPSVIRIVLSGHSELETVLRTVPIAHQFLAKPCDAAVLVGVIERVLAANDLLPSPELRARVCGVGTIPSLPSAFEKLVNVLSDPSATVPAITRIVEADMGMAVKILQLVSSAFFGPALATNNISKAVAYLGAATIRNLVMAMGFCPSVYSSPEGSALFCSIERHSVLTARLAERMVAVREPKLADEAFMAGMLHDIGILIIAHTMPVEYQRIGTLTGSGRAFVSAEREVLGATHAEVGAYLLKVWGIPDSIVRAVAGHESPEPESHDVERALFLASAVSNEVLCGHETSKDSLALACTVIGGIEELDVWRAMAAEIAGELED